MTESHLTPERESAPARLAGRLAPATCVTLRAGAGDSVILRGRDLDGNILVEIHVAREDASAWWVTAIRCWLWMKKGVRGLRLLKQG